MSEAAVPQNPDELFQKRLEDLVMDRVTAANPFAEYLVDRLQGAKEDRDRLMQNLAQMEQQFEALKNERVAVEGRIRGYVTDLRKWDFEEWQKKDVPVVPLHKA